MSKTWVAAHKERVRDSAIEVVEPNRATEFEVQATIWHGLRQLGFGARGEVKCRFSGRAHVRFDIAVFDGEVLVGLIECKREGKQMNGTWASTRQGMRYQQFGVPVRLVKGMDEALRLLEDAARGALWSQPP